MCIDLLLVAKRSLGQGNIFRIICQSFCPQGGGGCTQTVGMHGWGGVVGVCMSGIMHGRRWHVWCAGEMTTEVGSTHPTGMHSCCN